MIFLKEFKRKWEKLDITNSTDVVKEMLVHEIITRPDIRDAFKGINLKKADRKSIINLICKTNRRSLVSHFFTISDWRIWQPTFDEILDITRPCT